MRLTIAYSKIKKRNLVLINNATYQRETLSERPSRQPLSVNCNASYKVSDQSHTSILLHFATAQLNNDLVSKKTIQQIKALDHNFVKKCTFRF